MRMEQAFLFKEEHIVFSADAINKILVGDVLCVSRYHQIRKLYMVEDIPITNDHDFPMGTKIIPCGKMPLMKKGVFLQDIFGEVISSTTSHESYIYDYDNVKVDTGYGTDACVVDVDDDLDGDEVRLNLQMIPCQSTVILLTKLQIGPVKTMWISLMMRHQTNTR